MVHGINTPFITSDPVGFEKYPVEAQDFGNIANRIRIIYGIHHKLIKKTRKITNCNWLDLETLRV